MTNVPYGFCHCECGMRTTIAKGTDSKWGAVKGEPRRFIRGHANRKLAGPMWIEQDCGHDTPCWVWQRAKVNGYGRMYVGGRNRIAHRVYYGWLKGEIPEGLHLDHLCRNRACVNPDHLEPVTQAENNRRAWARAWASPPGALANV